MIGKEVITGIKPDGFSGITEIARKLLASDRIVPDDNPRLTEVMQRVLGFSWSCGYRIQEYEQRELHYPFKYYTEKMFVFLSDGVVGLKSEIKSSSQALGSGTLQLTVWRPDGSTVFKNTREEERLNKEYDSPYKTIDNPSLVVNSECKTISEINLFLSILLRFKPDVRATMDEFENISRRNRNTPSFKLDWRGP
jgi:hypothetical protein